MIAATKDEVAQKKGVVAIGYNVNRGNIFQTKALKDIVMNMAYIRDGIPLKWSVYHFLYDWNNPALKFAISLTQSFAGKELRLRFKENHGSHQECAYHLLSFGIPSRILPLDHDGELRNDIHLQLISQWEQLNKQIQQQNEKNLLAANDGGKVAIAKSNDILLGRGRPYQNHAGNQKLADIIEQKRVEYTNASKQGKTVISKQVVDYIKQTLGGRFLTKDKNN